MSRIFKICVVSHPKESENVIFVIKPNVIDFDTFKNEIFIRMPELMDHTLTFFYQDVNGTNATISNGTDFEAFYGKSINKLFVTKINTTENSEESRHANIMCNGCSKKICGYRYKCLDCSDFNLCVECEPKMHYHHLMIRIDKPSDEPVNDEHSDDGFVRSGHSESRSGGIMRHRRGHLHELFQRGHHHDHKIRHFQKKHGHHGKHHLFKHHHTHKMRNFEKKHGHPAKHLFKHLHRSHGPYHQLKRPHHYFKGPHHHLHRPHHHFKGPFHHHHDYPGPSAVGHPHARHSYFSVDDHAESSDTPNTTLIDLSDTDDEDTQILIV